MFLPAAAGLNILLLSYDPRFISYSAVYDIALTTDAVPVLPVYFVRDALVLVFTINSRMSRLRCRRAASGAFYIAQPVNWSAFDNRMPASYDTCIPLIALRVLVSGPAG